MTITAAQLRTKGQLIRRVEQLTESTVKLVDQWVADVWADVKSVTGNEKWQAGAVASNATHEVVIRGLAQPIETNWRFVFTDRFGVQRRLEIGAVIDISERHQRNRFILLRCSEVNSDE